MDRINTILNYITKNCFIASIDESPSVKIYENFQQYLKTEFLDKRYKVVYFLNSLAS